MAKSLPGSPSSRTTQAWGDFTQPASPAGAVPDDQLTPADLAQEAGRLSDFIADLDVSAADREADPGIKPAVRERGGGMEPRRQFHDDPVAERKTRAPMSMWVPDPRSKIYRDTVPLEERYAERTRADIDQRLKALAEAFVEFSPQALHHIAGRRLIDPYELDDPRGSRSLQVETTSYVTDRTGVAVPPKDEAAVLASDPYHIEIHVAKPLFDNEETVERSGGPPPEAPEAEQRAPRVTKHVQTVERLPESHLFGSQHEPFLKGKQNPSNAAWRELAQRIDPSLMNAVARVVEPGADRYPYGEAPLGEVWPESLEIWQIDKGFGDPYLQEDGAARAEERMLTALMPMAEGAHKARCLADPRESRLVEREWAAGRRIIAERIELSSPRPEDSRVSIQRAEACDEMLYESREKHRFAGRVAAVVGYEWQTPDASSLADADFYNHVTDRYPVIADAVRSCIDNPQTLLADDPERGGPEKLAAIQRTAADSMFGLEPGGPDVPDSFVAAWRGRAAAAADDALRAAAASLSERTQASLPGLAAAAHPTADEAAARLALATAGDPDFAFPPGCRLEPGAQAPADLTPVPVRAGADLPPLKPRPAEWTLERMKQALGPAPPDRGDEALPSSEDVVQLRAPVRCAAEVAVVAAGVPKDATVFSGAGSARGRPDPVPEVTAALKTIAAGIAAAEDERRLEQHARREAAGAELAVKEGRDPDHYSSPAPKSLELGPVGEAMFAERISSRLFGDSTPKYGSVASGSHESFRKEWSKSTEVALAVDDREITASADRGRHLDTIADLQQHVGAFRGALDALADAGLGEQVEALEGDFARYEARNRSVPADWKGVSIAVGEELSFGRRLMSTVAKHLESRGELEIPEVPGSRPAAVLKHVASRAHMAFFSPASGTAYVPGLYAGRAATSSIAEAGRKVAGFVEASIDAKRDYDERQAALDLQGPLADALADPPKGAGPGAGGSAAGSKKPTPRGGDSPPPSAAAAAAAPKAAAAGSKGGTRSKAAGSSRTPAAAAEPAASSARAKRKRSSPKRAGIAPGGGKSEKAPVRGKGRKVGGGRAAETPPGPAKAPAAAAKERRGGAPPKPGGGAAPGGTR